MTGFLLIDKPENWTSHDVVGYLRKITKEKRIGHSGTLDPFATGLLIVAIGRECTKRLEKFKNLDKEYIATIKLGATSDTQDRTGVIQKLEKTNTKIETINVDKIKTVLKSFVGTQEQIPPMYSAKKIDGGKLYDLARAGKEIERKPSQITIHSIELVDYKNQQLIIKCNVSTGTYIRTLAHDIGQKLEVGAYCEELRRTKIGEYLVENAIIPNILTPEIIEKRLFTT